MKFLIALSVLASTTVFANVNDRYIKCYESPQQTGHHEVAYKFKTKHDHIRLVYPDITVGYLSQVVNGEVCLVGFNDEQEMTFRGCPGEGQEIGRLVPVEVDQETVYCERSILPWFEAPDTNF
ncbi:MAG: hypothetical protein H0V66_11765 [Bdellovibrionales bacterium]|nr:hypothetical protein [Bdellovibrionales bacterium]